MNSWIQSSLFSSCKAFVCFIFIVSFPVDCQVTQTRERAVSKERVTQSKIVDLETQLSRIKTELNQLQRAKEEVSEISPFVNFFEIFLSKSSKHPWTSLQAERRYQSRLQDVKDRLEQSDSTNRSLQSYVQFLKSSYVNVFGDPALTGSSFRTPSPIWKLFQKSFKTCISLLFTTDDLLTLLCFVLYSEKAYLLDMVILVSTKTL